MKKYDKILTIILFLIEVFYFLLINQLPKKAARYPYFVLSLLFILTIVLAVNSFLKKSTDNFDKEDKKFTDIELKQFFFIIFLSAVYIIFIDIIGFFSTTIIYLLVVMIGLKSNIKWAIITSIVFSIFIYLIFVIFLKVPVPKGILI